MSELPAVKPKSADGIIDASVSMPWFFLDEAMASINGLPDTLGAQALWTPAF